MAQVIGSYRTLSDIAESYREDGAARDSAALLSLGALVDHLIQSYADAQLFCWTSVWTLCISQHAWTSPSDWLPYLRIEPVAGGQLEFRFLDSQLPNQDWIRVVSPERVVERFDKFVDQLRWRPAIRDLRQP